MFDPRVKTLAKNLVHFSCNVRPGENVLIEQNGVGSDDLIRALIKEVYAAGGTPFVWISNKDIERELQLGATADAYRMRAEWDCAVMSKMQAYIGVRAGDNTRALCDVPSASADAYAQYYWDPVHGDIRVNRTKWVVLRYPTPSMAQAASVSTEAFEDFYFDVCNLDYAKLDTAMDPLKELMEKTDRVRITGPDTDISFSIKGIPAVKCSGQKNIPDGELFTAPVRDSVNGVISYNTPSLSSGVVFSDIRFEFRNGKIVKATSNDTKRINEILDADDGARYIGEFSFGLNPYINKPMLDTLFDEKIAGSFHFTPGACYEGEAENGNRSSVHWDLVMIQTPEFGGGEIYFDDVLIRKDGRFVLPQLLCLNPENLI